MNQSGHTIRYPLVGALFCVLPVLIMLQVLRIQVDPDFRQDIITNEEMNRNVLRSLIPARGQIYDRRGHLLAGNKKVYEVGVELKFVGEDAQFVAHTASILLKLDYSEAFRAVSTTPDKNNVYVTLARNVPQETIDEIDRVKKRLEEQYSSGEGENANLDALIYSPHLARIYPEKDLASNVMGFVNGESSGFYGVEQRFNELLAGDAKTVLVSLAPVNASEIPSIPSGASLVLTIDREIQRAMEALIDNAVAENGAEAGTIVVMQPQTGEVLAMATTPRMDLNEYWRYTEVYPEKTPYNRAVGSSYEPGSVYKVLTMAAALDAEAVQPETVFVDTGSIEIGGTIIYNWNMGAWGPQDMTGCLQHSLNVCLAWIAKQLGPNNFYHYMNAFGIGHPTGVDLAGEAAGRLKTPGDADWYEADLGTNSFGQGVAATPIQMATAASAIANKGRMMAPIVVRSVINDGYQHDIEQRVLGQPIKPETALTLSEMLAHSLEKESSDALVEGYRVAGKTGTAEIPTPLGYTTNETNASFVGWGPVDDPQFLVYVWLERPSTSPWGSVVASPVFRQAVEQLVVFLNLPPDEVRLQMAKESQTAP